MDERNAVHRAIHTLKDAGEWPKSSCASGTNLGTFNGSICSASPSKATALSHPQLTISPHDPTHRSHRPGSNTTRLVVYDYEPGRRFHLVDEVREVVRLREGMGNGMALRAAAIDRAQADAHVRQLLPSQGIDDIVMTATSAVRDARNGAWFLARSGPTPAGSLACCPAKPRLLRRAGRNQWHGPARRFVIDLGGGSAEIVEVRKGFPERCVSLPLMPDTSWSAITVLSIAEGPQQRRLVFSGDVGRHGMAILRDPEVVSEADVLIMESTYGNRRHETREQAQQVLRRVVNETHRRHGKVIIPAFAVGRTQELVYALQQLSIALKIPVLNMYVDSPLAVNVTEVFRSHPECYDAEMMELIEHKNDPFGFRKMSYVRDVED